jgi:transposase
MTYMPDIASLRPDATSIVVQQLLAENARLGSALHDVRVELAAKDAEVRDLQARLKAQEAEADRLRAKAAEPQKTPQNSSIPPSRGEKPQGDGKLPRPRRRGRKGSHRPLCAHPRRIENVLAKTCQNCPADVPAVPQAAAEMYDNVAIPPIEPMVTQVVLHGGTCPCGNKEFKAKPPDGLEPWHLFGPRLVALVILLRQYGFVSFERLVVMLQGMFGVTVSEGGLSNMLRRQVAAFKAQQERIRQDVRRGKQIESGETAMRVGKKRWQQWVFHNGLNCCFVAAMRRSKTVVEEFLGGVRPEVWVSDRLGSQMGWATLHQLCLAHLLRTCQHIIDCGDVAFAWRIMALLRRAIWHHRMRGKIIMRLGAGAPMAFRHRINAEMDELLRDEPSHPAARKLRRSLIRAREHLFVFLDHPEVPPANNGSERALRPGVIFRKVTDCFRSEWGAHLHCAVRSAIETGRRRGIGALDAIMLTIQDKPLLVSE